MKIKSTAVSVLMTLLVSMMSNAQNDCTLESYYSNPDIFREYEIHEEMLIDGKRFKIVILSDKQSEYMNPYPDVDYDYDDHAPKTLLFYDLETDSLVYAKKFDGSNPTFRKPNGAFNEEGKVYLSWFSSGGGSGYTVSTHLVSLNRNQEIDFDLLYRFGELSYLLFNKNDEEILELSGIWGMGEDETHFSDHNYDVILHKHSTRGIKTEHLGTTTKQYSSGDQSLPSPELLQLIYEGESFFPLDFKVNEYMAR